MKRLLCFLTAILILISLSGCNNNINELNNEDNSEVINNNDIKYPMSIIDKFGDEIIIEKEPETVISFSPELVEIMYAIDAGDKLIGRSLYCNYPEETSTVPDMGDLFNLNIETIVESNPDLLLLSSMVTLDIADSLKNNGINVLVLDEDTSFDGVYEYINILGKVFNKEKEAENLNLKMKADIKQIQDKVENLEKPTVYFIVGFGEFDSTATGDTFTSEILEMAGAINAAADGEKWMYNIERLVEKDPDYLLCSNKFDSKNQIMITEGYKDLTAVKENRIFEVDEDIFSRQGPRIVEAISVLAEYLHPEAF